MFSGSAPRRFPWMRRLALASILFALACVIAYVSLQEGWLRFNYPSMQRYPIRGIDVSHHQGEVDWTAVRDDGVLFVYLKATEGGDFVDSQFARNWTQARGAGLAVGAYHFFTFCRDSASQARNYLATVPRAADALPPAVDLEFGGNCGRIPSAQELRKELLAFLEPVRAAYGRQPVLYVTREFFDVYMRDDGGLTVDQQLWARDVFRSPRWLGRQAWTFWQFGNRGRVAGISGPVDLNVFHGDQQAWNRFRAPPS